MRGLQSIISLFFATCLINSLKHEHSCKILCVVAPNVSGPGFVTIVHSILSS